MPNSPTDNSPIFAAFASPARRALQSMGITTLARLAKIPEAKLLGLHGFGPSSIPVLRKLLAEAGSAKTTSKPTPGKSSSVKKKAATPVTAKRGVKEISQSRKAATPDETAAVEKFIKGLEPALRAAVEKLRKIITGASPMVSEHIKWNHPAFYYNGPMKPFNPKEYKSDIVVMNLHRGRIMLVFPGGSVLKDASNLLTGDYKDGRRIIVFGGLAEINKQEKVLGSLIRQWIALVE